MAESTNIAWARSTFNPWIGCTKVSPGCDHCYAAVSTPARTLGIEWGPGTPRHRTSAATWKQPLRWNEQQKIALSACKKGLDMVGGDEAELIARGFIKPEPWRVFCGSLCDVFDNEVPDEWRYDLFDLWAATPHLTWLVLTKRIGNAAKMLPWTPGDGSPGCEPLWNVWLGASVVNQEEADRDIPKLLATPAAKRFVSYEPALGAVDWRLNRIREWNALADQHAQPAVKTSLDWIIVGGESDQPGMKARPFDVQWARDTVRQCREAGVAVFVKQLGSNPAPLVVEANSVRERLWIKDRAGADPTEWPEDLRVQEFPR